jgi:tRNA(fMet)-specific endonuclease VapC
MYLLDTNICIYVINKSRSKAVEKINSLQPFDLKISAVSVAELEYGAAKSLRREQNRAALLNFVSAFHILPFDERDAEYYGLIRADLESRGALIGAYDLQIAAQALARGLTLVTNNLKEFRRIKNLKLENWA